MSEDGPLVAYAFSSLTPRQRDAVLSIAFGGNGSGFHPRTLDALVQRGLIEPVQMEERVPEFGGATFKWTAYTMPIPVHIALCEWCSQQSESEEEP